MASPGAKALARGRLLLDAINIANSDTSAVEFLSLLSEEDFTNFGEDDNLPGSLNQINIDKLRSICKERLQANITAARTRREELETLREKTAQLAQSKATLEADHDSSKLKAKASGRLDITAHFVSNIDEHTKKSIYYEMYSALKLAEAEERRRGLTPDNIHEIERIDDQYAKRLVYDKYKITEDEGIRIMIEGDTKKWARPALSY